MGENNVADFTGDVEENQFRAHLFAMLRFGGDTLYPAIPELLAAGWNSNSNLLFNWAMHK